MSQLQNQKSFLKSLKKPRAFSLIELAVVLVMAGIIITLITKGAGLIGESAIVNARYATSKSPATSIDGLALWLDATDENSFDKSEFNNSLVTIWKDSNPVFKSKNGISITNDGTPANGPLFVENGINNLPAVQFTGVSGNYIKATFSSDFTNSQPQTIFLAINILSNTAKTIIDVDSGSVSSLYLGASGSLGANSGSSLSSGNNLIANGGKYIIAYVQNGALSLIRVNGNQVASGAVGANILGSAIKIGCAATGTSCVNANIGEVIIFNDALDSEGYKMIEKYLSNKWKIKIS